MSKQKNTLFNVTDFPNAKAFVIKSEQDLIGHIYYDGRNKKKVRSAVVGLCRTLNNVKPVRVKIKP
jgi:hypothetical protein